MELSLPYFWHSARKPHRSPCRVSQDLCPAWVRGEVVMMPHDANGILKGLKRGCNGIE
jgi:hypothetical protein